MKWSCRTILNKAQSLRGVVFRGVPVELPGTKVPVAALLLRIQLTVARVKPTRPAIALCHIPSQACVNTSCLIHIGVERGLTRIEKKICNCCFQLPTVRIFGEMTTLAAVLDFNDPTWHLNESLAKVWSDCFREQSQVHFVSISAHWKHKNSIHIDFVASNRGVTICIQECITGDYE